MFSRGQLRICFVLFFFFLAIKIVLYQSATYAVSLTARDRRYVEVKRVLQENTKERIALKSRMRLGRIFIQNEEESERSKWTGESTESARFSDKWSRGGANYVQSEGERTRSVKSDVHQTAESLQSNSSLSRPQASNVDTLNPGSSSIMADSAKSDHDFDSEKVLLLFQKCKDENGDLSVECYNDAYEELCKLFKPLGTIFNFVTSDIVEKIGILRDYQKSEIGEHFRTIQTMVKYEVDNNLTNQKKKASGCRTLLRLHRALEFISALLTKIRNTDNSCKFSTEATEAYDKTLAKYHPWLIRKAVHVAMYTLPDRQNLLIKMKVPDTPEGMAKVEALIGQLNMVYDITQKLYAEHNLLDLP